jgi:hypothetical protein
VILEKMIDFSDKGQQPKKADGDQDEPEISSGDIEPGDNNVIIEIINEDD